MKRLVNRYLIPKIVLGIVALGGLVVFASNNATVSRALNFARPDVRVQISGSVERDDKSVLFEKAGAVKAGELLDWNISSTNVGTAEAQNYRVVGQIPNGTTFVADTAKGENAPQLTYSIDAGKTFSAVPMIDEKQPDGTIKKVAAPVSMYTQVMFEWAAPLAPEAKLNTTYRVRVK